jgi:hypothetical protein
MHKVWILNSRSNEAQVNDLKPKASSKKAIYLGKTAKINNWQESGKRQMKK